MDIQRLHEAPFENGYGILCTSFPRLPKHLGLHPNFCRIPYKGHTTPHAHGEAELFFIISGNGLIIIDNETEVVKACDLIRIPSFANHQLKNEGRDELIFLSVYSDANCEKIK